MTQNNLYSYDHCSRIISDLRKYAVTGLRTDDESDRDAILEIVSSDNRSLFLTEFLQPLHCHKASWIASCQLAVSRFVTSGWCPFNEAYPFPGPSGPWCRTSMALWCGVGPSMGRSCLLLGPVAWHGVLGSDAYYSRRDDQWCVTGPHTQSVTVSATCSHPAIVHLTDHPPGRASGTSRRCLSIGLLMLVVL